jgi:acylphosphatase
MKTFKIVVSGRVQNVGYRMSCLEKANMLEIRGTVHNTRFGQVEISAQGKRVDEFMVWCRVGPILARVDSVDVSTTEEPAYEGFTVI